MVDAVDLFRRQLQSQLLHISMIQTFNEHQKPHSFVRTNEKAKEQSDG
jgi:hypothetical protein